MKKIFLVMTLVACCSLATACTNKDSKTETTTAATETSAEVALPTAPEGVEVATVPDDTDDESKDADVIDNTESVPVSKDEENNIVHPTAPEGVEVTTVPANADEENNLVHPTAPDGEQIETAPFDAEDTKITAVDEPEVEPTEAGTEAVEK